MLHHLLIRNSSVLVLTLSILLHCLLAACALLVLHHAVVVIHKQSDKGVLYLLQQVSFVVEG